MKNALVLAAALALFPASAFAEVSLADIIPEEDAFSIDAAQLDMDLNLDVAHPGAPRPGVGPRPRPGHGPAPRPGYGPAPRPRGYHPVVVHPHVVRPTVVVVDETPSTVVVDDTPVSYEPRGVFGFGMRFLGVTNSPVRNSVDCDIANDFSGGFGFYLKIRPVRYLSFELANDYLWGSYDGEYSMDYMKIPFTLGLRAHFLDYGSVDFYAAAAASVAITSFATKDIFGDNSYFDYGPDFTQWGGQLGLGLNFIAGVFEIGLDVRYTIEEAPDFASGYYYEEEKADPIHGFQFALNVGFAI